MKKRKKEQSNHIPQEIHVVGNVNFMWNTLKFNNSIFFIAYINQTQIHIFNKYMCEDYLFQM